MILVIGGGPAGRLGAMRLGRAGRQVTLVERAKVGGQCLHHGCMVVCALNDIARTIRSVETLERLGITGAPVRVDFPEALRRMAEIQGRIQGVLEEETRQAGVEIRYGVEAGVEGRRAFLDGEEVEAEAVLVATGSRPEIPEIQGLDPGQVITPHNLHGMRRLPGRLLVLGGGVMAAEFACIFRAFGSEVTILARSTFLKALNPFLRKLARRELEGVRIEEGVRVERVVHGGEGVTLQCRQEERDLEFAGDALLIATGLRPNSECVQGVEKGPMGEILVDDRMRTSVSGVYAAGDVTGPPYLTPVARMEGIVAAENILGVESRADYRCIPQSLSLANDLVYCERESDARRLASLSAPCPAGGGSFWHVAEGYTGASRLTLDPETGELVGVAMAAPGASIAGAYLSALLSRGVTVEELEFIKEVHPSDDGLIPLLRFAAEKFGHRRRGGA